MPNSDVVVGWVTDGGETVFHDRFARDRIPPTIDEQQDWILEGGEEENGFTILEFSRKYVTCDDYDLPIMAETARVIWSFHATTDPTSEVIPRELIHTSKGALSLNLLGGLPDAAPNPQDLEYFDIKVDNIVIPKKDTTYWCSVSKVPDNLLNKTGYITKFGPIVTEGNEAHVHHLVVYICSGINDSHIGNGGDCKDDAFEFQVQRCRSGTFIAAWAVGGEDFTYPDNVAYPFGGEGYIMMELHFDNPKEIEGTKDSSGMRLWYTTTPREYDAGIFEVGYFIGVDHVIPPNSENFVTQCILPGQCTTKILPEDGIHVFANFFHTHLVGHGLTLQHLRYNSDCDVYEELEPIDRNLQYDFNFQQINHLRREVTVKPGDIIQLKCFYRTVGIENVTFGGESTHEEMCVSFVVYYPKLEASFSFSYISKPDYNEFLSKSFPGQQILSGEVENADGLNAIDWEKMRDTFQTTLDNGTQTFFCGNAKDFVYGGTKFPEIGCSYIAPDQCTNSTPPTCCERISTTEDGVVLRASVALLLLLSLLAATLG